MTNKKSYGQVVFFTVSLCIFIVVMSCSCTSKHSGDIPSETISFIYMDSAPGNWDRLSFQAYNDGRENRLVYSASVIDSEGVGDVHIVWKGNRIDVVSLSDADRRLLEDDGFKFWITPSGYELSYLSSGENPPFNLLVKVRQETVIQVSLYSRGYPDPAMGNVSFMPISIEISPGKVISFPQNENWVLDTFGRWDMEHVSSGN